MPFHYSRVDVIVDVIGRWRLELHRATTRAV